MKKYYIFSINREFYEVYKNNQAILFKTLENLYKLKLDNAYYGITTFNQLCNPINKTYIKKYLNGKNSQEKLYIVDNYSLIEINTSCLILLTNNKIPSKIKNINYYEAPLFLCDFDNMKFFFLKGEYT